MLSPFDERETFLREIYETYFSKLEHMCLYKIGNDGAHRDLIDNCIQDTFLLAHQLYDELKHHPNIEAWLKKVCNNRLIPYVARLDEKLGRTLSLELLDDKQLGNEPDVSERILSGISSQEKIDGLMLLLSSAEKDVCQLYHLEHNTIKEIAELRKTSTSSVKMMLNRIRTKAKKAREKNSSSYLTFLVTFWVFRYFIK